MGKRIRFFLAIFFIFLMVTPSFFRLQPNLNPNPQSKKQFNNNYNSGIPKVSSKSQNLSSSQPFFSEIFPVVQKSIEYSETYLYVNFSVTNSLAIPLHNFTLAYYRCKSSSAEFPVSGNIALETPSCQFLVKVTSQKSQLIFNFTMTPASVLVPGEDIALQVVVGGVLDNYTLSDDGVIWKSAETIPLPIIYSLEDPSQEFLNPAMECAKTDFDSDGLTNLEEWNLGLNPFRQEFYIRWVQRTGYFKLPAENISNPNLLYLSHAIINVPPNFEGIPLSLTLQKLGFYSVLKDITVNSRVIYPELSEINFPFIISLESGLKHIEFTLENFNPAYDIEYNLSFQINGQTPLDLTGNSSDWDGDLLLDSYERANGLLWTNPDTDGDGIIDGIDFSPSISSILLPHMKQIINIPVNATNSHVDVRMQMKPLGYDYSINHFPYSDSSQIQILPGLRLYAEKDRASLPDNLAHFGDNISYVPFTLLKDSTASFYNYMGEFSYEAGNPALSDNQITLSFEPVWFLFEQVPGESPQLLHIFDADQEFLLQGLSIHETQGINLTVILVGDGTDEGFIQRSRTLLSLLSQFPITQDGTLIYGLENITELHWLSSYFVNPELVPNTTKELSYTLSDSLSLDPAATHSFIYAYTQDSFLSSFLGFFEQREVKIARCFLSVSGIAMSTFVFAEAWSLTPNLYFEEVESLCSFYGIKFVSWETLPLTSKFRYMYLGFDEFTSVSKFGTLLKWAGGIFAVVEIFFSIIGIVNIVTIPPSEWDLSIILNLISQVCSAVSGALILFAMFGLISNAGLGALVAILLAAAAFVLAILSMIFSVPEAPSPPPEPLHPNAEVQPASENPSFDLTTLTYHQTPEPGSYFRVGWKFNNTGNVDMAFRVKIKIGDGPWSDYNTSGVVEPNHTKEIYFSYPLLSTGIIHLMSVHIEYNFLGMWGSQEQDVPLEIPVFPSTVGAFWNMLLNGVWFRGRAGVALQIGAANPTMAIGGNLDFTVTVQNLAATPQQFRLNLYESYGKVTSIWEERTDYSDPFYFLGWWLRFIERVYRAQIATDFPIITPVLKPLEIYTFGFTLKIPSTCTLGILGPHHLLFYAQSTTEPDLMQFRQASFTVIPSQYYAVGVSPNTAWTVPGENVSWAVELHNIGSIPDNYTLSLDTLGVIDPAWISILSGNATLGPCHTYYFPIEASIPRTWSIPPGDYIRLSIASENYPGVTYTHFPLLKILPLHDLRVIAIQPTFSIRPGTPSSVAMTLQNLGNVPETVSCATFLEGFDPSPFSSPTSIQIQPGETKQVIFQLDAAREPLLTPGNYTPALGLINDESILLTTTSSNVTVLDFYDVAFLADPATLGTLEIPHDIFEDRPYAVTVQVKNIGNMPDQFTLDLRPLARQNIGTLSLDRVTLSPNEEACINITIIPQVRGIETYYLVAYFLDWDGSLQMKNISLTLNVIDEDILPPTVYFIEAIPSLVTDGEMASNIHYRTVHWALNDTSGIHEMAAFYDGIPVEFQTLEEPVLMIGARTPDETEIFNMGTPECPVDLAVTHQLGESMSNYYTGDLSPSFLNYFTVDLTAQAGQIYEMKLFLNGEEISPIAWNLFPWPTFYQHRKCTIAIPQEVGTYQFNITIKTCYWLNSYTCYLKNFYVVLGAEVIQVNESYLIELPIQVDDPATPENESYHCFAVRAIDNDFDLGLSEDRASIMVNRSICMVDDDTSPPDISLNTFQITDMYDLSTSLLWEVTDTPKVIDDSLAQFGFQRTILVGILDASGIAALTVTYEIESFDGKILFSKTYTNDSQSYFPLYTIPFLPGFTLVLIPLIVGYHHLNITCTDGDNDRVGDALSSSKATVFTIFDDDETPLELENLTLQSDLLLNNVPMLELQAHITDPKFGENPAHYQFVTFVDGQWVPNATISYEFFRDETVNPPLFREAVVKIRVENTWVEDGVIGNHTVELVTIDDDWDVIYNSVDLFYPYSAQNFALYQILQMTENVSVFDLTSGKYTGPAPSTAGFYYNLTILHKLADLLGIFGFPYMNLTIIDLEGRNVTQNYYAGGYFSPILPSLYLSAQLFYIWVTKMILNSYHIPWQLQPASMITVARSTMALSLASSQVFTRDTLTFTLYPQLLMGTPTLFHTFANGTTIFMPTECLTATYDLATGILLHVLLEHIADPTNPADVNLTHFEAVLRDTNILAPYEFQIHNQSLPLFVPADASVKSFFTSFAVVPRYGLEAFLTPPASTTFDNESAIYLLNITNSGTLQDSFYLSLVNLTLGTGLFSAENYPLLNRTITLPPKTSALITLEITASLVGTEPFTILITSRGDPALNISLQAILTIQDDDTEPPCIPAFSITADFQYITIQLEIIDPSGVGALEVYVDGGLIPPLYSSQNGTRWTITLQNAWIMAWGSHAVFIRVCDADNDRPNDALSVEVTGTFEMTITAMKEFVKGKIDQLNEAIRNAPDNCWTGPVANRKSALNNKLLELRDLVSLNAFGEAYDNLLHDIKPKLTGLKTDETEAPWGNGVFNNPWITCPQWQELFRGACNEILTYLLVLNSL